MRGHVQALRAAMRKLVRAKTRVQKKKRREKKEAALPPLHMYLDAHARDFGA